MYAGLDRAGLRSGGSKLVLQLGRAFLLGESLADVKNGRGELGEAFFGTLLLLLFIPNTKSRFWCEEKFKNIDSDQIEGGEFEF